MDTEAAVMDEKRQMPARNKLHMVGFPKGPSKMPNTDVPANTLASAVSARM
jgi:hypothetical protein